ncbi:CID domain [Popillia japonica]|uniref:CID domain n=1 Tax=Popillia japonica TaxID=7064 RepID=A0AAW1LVQ7_POPJA
MSTAKEAKECYISTLADLTFNSKPLINVLTMLAEENIAHAPVIVEAIESHLIKGPVDVKLPALYLIDCIIKNIGGVYKSLLSQNIVSIFCHVFQVVNEKTRGEMFKLRQTWNEELAKSKLCDLDVKVKQLDPAWPIVMPQLTNNIHLNPKFLHNSAIPKKSPPITIPSQTQMTSLIANRDLDTIEMQKNFIMKQKQLLELERMKLELDDRNAKEFYYETEAITRVGKNEIRIGAATAAIPEDTTKLPKTQNILLKPEVAKQLANSAPATITKTKSASASGILGQKLQGDQTAAMTTSSTPRIAPVNSALLAAATSRPIRDPRLLRHQRNATGSTTTSTTTSTNMSTTVNTNVLLESKISNSNTTAANAESISTNNKNFSSKVSVREHHRTTEPRLVANKDSSIIAPHQANSNSISSRSNKLSQSPSKRSSIAASKLSPVSSDSSPSSMKTLKANRVSSKSSSSLSSGSSGGGSSTSLLDSPSKKANGGSDKETKSTPSPVKQDSSPTSVFKEVKGSKSRNYIRRNRQPSLSPELVSMDVDLRSSAAPPEKQPRLQPDTAEEKVNLGSATDLTTPSMDVDLRQLPAIIGKKRPSTESSESISVKKSKMEVFDELFGNEDTDLRQLPGAMSSPKVQDRPPTPPPPIISSKSKSDLDDSNDVKIISPKSSNLDLVREKLANATIRNKLNSKFSMTGEQRKSLLRTKLQPSNEDVDLRTNLDDSFNKILISPADEQCIRAGNMTKEQETALMNKILAQIESQKLKEAKRTEESTGNISLQPISDDELEADFSGSSDEETAAFRSNVYADKDERVPPPAPHIKVNDNFGSFPRNNMDMRRGMWRGNRPRRGIIPGRGMRMMRPPGPPENWIRPNWRPMAPGFGKHPPVFNPEVLDIDNVNNSNVDMYDQNSNQGMSSMQETPEIMIVDCANQDNVKSIVIDNESRDIRYYNDTAVVFMSSSDPREISFQNGSRKVFFGENDVTIVSFNEPYKDVNVNGIPHKVKLGGPSRELHVDDKWYECFIGGPGIRIELDGEFTMVKIEGPPPQVKIGQTKRTDLVAGKINLIVDAKTMIPVFLDAKLQTFDINGQTHTLKFVNSLQMALIDDTPFDIEFGGLPKPIVLHDKKYYIRFSVLPRGIKPGQVNIQDMESITLSVDPTEPVLPVINKRSLQKGGPNSPDRNSNSPLSIQNLLQQQNLSSNLDTLSSLMASSLMPSQSSSGLNSSSYQVENDVFVESSSQNAPEIPATTAALTSTNILPPSLNINELFQKLVATGIVTTMQENQPSLKKESLPQIKPVMFAKPETLKVRQSALIMTLYSGMQCSSCGMRFPPEHSMQYSQHLDWHFRQNRKGKRNIRKASSRRWYYSLSDWKNYEEIEDLEEREKSYFENQQQSQAEGAPDEAEEEIEIPSVPADPTVQDARCEVCQDRFDQFYNEEKEEWHLRMAIRIDGKNYHPVCYEDYQASLMDTTYDEIQKDSDKIDEIIPGLEVASDDINKDVDSSEPTEIVIDDDESEQTDAIDRVEDEDSKSQEVFPKMEEEDEDGEDDDVIINEVVPEKIDLVDDDKYEDMQPHEPTSIVVKEEPVDDGFVDVEGGVIKAKSITDVKIKTEPIDPGWITDVKIKTEPIDPDDELQITGEEQLDSMKSHKQEAHHTEVVTFIDGNVEFDSSVPPTGGISGKIKINITKPLPVIAPKENTNKELSSELEKTAESIDPSQPLPPGEEPIQLNLKPALQGVKLKKIPPVKKGTELTGLCSIM